MSTEPNAEGGSVVFPMLHNALQPFLEFEGRDQENVVAEWGGETIQCCGLYRH